MTNHTQLDDKLGEADIDNFQVWKYRTFVILEEIENQGFLFRELPSTIFRKGVHWTTQFEQIYLSIQLYLKYSKF